MSDIRQLKNGYTYPSNNIGNEEFSKEIAPEADFRGLKVYK